MLLTLALILFVLWLLGLGFHLFAGFINVLLVLAVIMAIIHFFQNRTVST